MKKINSIVIAVLIGVIIYLLFQKRPIYTAGRLQTIEHVINGQDSIVTIWKTKLVHDKSKIKGMTSEVNRLKDSLTIAKELKDTVYIVEYQDVIIAKQDTLIAFYEDLTTKCDSIITTQNKTLDNKNEIISILRNDNKKVKRKFKVGSILAGIGLVTLLIVK